MGPDFGQGLFFFKILRHPLMVDVTFIGFIGLYPTPCTCELREL